MSHICVFLVFCGFVLLATGGLYEVVWFISAAPGAAVANLGGIQFLTVLSSVHWMLVEIYFCPFA